MVQISEKRFPMWKKRDISMKLFHLLKIDQAMIAYTLVNPEIRDYMKTKLKKRNYMPLILLAQLWIKFQQLYGKTPIYEPGIVRKLDDDYFRKIEAIEFAVKYDDGRDPRGILRADIVSNRCIHELLRLPFHNI